MAAVSADVSSNYLTLTARQLIQTLPTLEKKKKNETQKEWKERKEEKKGREEKKALTSGGKGGRGAKGERKFFPCIGPWILRTSMQVLIKRIQKRGASSFVWRCGRGSFGGVNLTPLHPRALRRFSLVSTFYHWASKLHLCTSTSGEAIGSTWGRGLRGTRLFFFSPLLTSLPYIHVSPNPPGCLWQGKWSTLFIHLLGSQTKASHCE